MTERRDPTPPAAEPPRAEEVAELADEVATVEADQVVPADQDDADARDAAGGLEEPTEHADLEAAAAADPRTRAEMLGELVAAEAKRDEYLDDLRRSHADFENYRRRVLRDGANQRRAGMATVVESLLEVLDDLDRTVEAARESPDEGLARGVELVAEKTAKSLQQLGVARVDQTGVPFDPSVHEAVQERPGDPPRDEPVVVEVLRPGYRLEDRTLRAAMVVVEQ